MIGDLRELLFLEAAVDSDDGAGGATRSWHEVTKLWGSVEEVRSRSGFFDDAESEIVRLRIVVRFLDLVKAGRRFRLDDRVLDIETVVFADEEDEHLACMCIERAG